MITIEEIEKQEMEMIKPNYAAWGHTPHMTITDFSLLLLGIEPNLYAPRIKKQDAMFANQKRPFLAPESFEYLHSNKIFQDKMQSAFELYRCLKSINWNKIYSPDKYYATIINDIPLKFLVEQTSKMDWLDYPTETLKFFEGCYKEKTVIHKIEPNRDESPSFIKDNTEKTNDTSEKIDSNAKQKHGKNNKKTNSIKRENTLKIAFAVILTETNIPYGTSICQKTQKKAGGLEILAKDGGTILIKRWTTNAMAFPLDDPKRYTETENEIVFGVMCSIAHGKKDQFNINTPNASIKLIGDEIILKLKNHYQINRTLEEIERIANNCLSCINLM